MGSRADLWGAARESASGQWVKQALGGGMPIDFGVPHHTAKPFDLTDLAPLPSARATPSWLETLETGGENLYRLSRSAGENSGVYFIRGGFRHA